MRLDHCLRLRHLIRRADGQRLLDNRFGRCFRAGFDGKKLIEPEISQEIAVSLIEIGHAQLALSQFAQAQGDAGERAHESRIHHGAIAQVHRKFPESAIHHLLGKLLQAGAIQKRAFSLDAHPDSAAGDPDENGRLYSHG